MKKTWISICLLGLSACNSKPNLHIYHQDLNDVQRFNLQQQLSGLQLNVHFSKLRHTHRYTAPQLIYHPDDPDPKLFGDLERVVKGLGFKQLNMNIFNRENHFYTQGNIGLYFPNKLSENELPSLLFMHNCEDEHLQVNIKSSGQWQLFGNKKMKIKGTWHYTKPYLTLKFNLDQQHFQQIYQGRQHTVQTLQGPKKATTFTIFGDKQHTVSLLGCDLQTIFA